MGTALAVIVPEGAEAFYEMREHGEEGAEMPNAIVGGALIVGFLAMLILESINWQGGGGGRRS